MSSALPPAELPFDIGEVLALVKAAVKDYPKAALFELAEAGFNRPFQVAVGCIISTRTRDEVTLKVVRRLFARAQTPAQVTDLSLPELEDLIRGAAFAETKARQIRAIAERALTEFGGELPCEEKVLLSLPGIGPKCANLVLGIACGRPRVAVDTHVHRVVHRWGYVSARTPEETIRALEARVPRQYWLDLNRLLVPFGKHVCRPGIPRCSVCPLAELCPRVGVTKLDIESTIRRSEGDGRAGRNGN